MSENTPTQDGVTIPKKSVYSSASVEQRLTDNARYNILPARYLERDEDGKTIEEPSEMFERVAENVASVEDDFDRNYWAGEFEHVMKTLQFVPNSPTLMNAGLDLQQLSACFVIEPEDDMDDILSKVRDAGLIFKSGGGVGYTFSHLRPKGTLVSSTKGQSSGPVSFMRLYDEVCQQVKQGGKRRGAQMGIMRVDHPDIGRFVTAKREEGAFSNFNISVAVTDEFKEAVQQGRAYTLYDPESDFEDAFVAISDEPTSGCFKAEAFYHPDAEDSPHDNIWEYADEIRTTEGTTLRERWRDADWDSLLSGEMQLPARFIWDIMVDGAWQNGEPGVFYIDETNREHTFDVDEHPEYEIHATNPCAEQPLCNYEACNLAHVNLSLFVEDDAPMFDDYDGHITDYFHDAVDVDRLNRVVRIGTRFLDNVATASDFPLQEIEDTVDDLRKIGLGVMGWAQMLYQMGIRYGSDDSLVLANEVMEHIDREATKYSHELAKERGSFPAWDDSKYADPTAYPEWFENHTYLDPAEYPDGYAMRNHNVTTVAPTGTTSMIADTSGGIEPVYNVAYRKNVGEDIQGQDMLVEFDSFFERALEANDYDVEAVKDEAETLMRNNEYDGPYDLPIDDRLAETFTTTGDVTPSQHTLMQRAFQDAVDSGISKTINLPSHATREDVAEAYTMALTDYEYGAPIKGLTVYRDQSREEQVLTTQEYSDQEVENAIEMLEDLDYEVSEP